MVAVETDLTSVLRILGEPTRLRLLALLDREELSVSELCACVGMAQSRVSNHLRTLREAGLLVERHAGRSTFLRFGRPDAGTMTERLWGALRAELAALPEHEADLERLERVLAEREGGSDFFDRVAGQWDTISGEFATGQARPRAVSHLVPAEFVVADLGCGTGYLSRGLLGQVRKVVAVDRSQGMLDEASDRLARSARSTELDFRIGELDALPIADDEVDGALAGMVLHHLDSADPAIREMARIVRPGGSAVVLDMVPHREGWMRSSLGDRHLGLDPSDVLAAFRRAGFEDTVLDPVDDHYRPKNPDGTTPSLSLYIVRGRVPLGSR